jgi:hypothetical protein
VDVMLTPPPRSALNVALEIVRSSAMSAYETLKAEAEAAPPLGSTTEEPTS